MKHINIESLEPGQRLAKTIFSSTGSVLLAEDVNLTVFMINTLRRIGVSMVYVRDPDFDDVVVEEVISEKTKVSIIKALSESFSMVKSGKEFDARAISLNTNQLIDEILNNKDILVQLCDIRSKDNSLYIHTTNVSIMSLMVGINIGLNYSQLKELAVGAILHDIGKLDPDHDDESVDEQKHHTWAGFKIIKTKKEFSLLSAHVALQHHENMDGTGLPRQVTGDQIHLYAKIVHIANMFDNLIAIDLMQPHQACEHMMAKVGTEIDQELLRQFLRVTSAYPNGTSVRLTTGESGVVVGQHRGLPGRPIVRIVKKEENYDIEVKEVDLAKQTTVFIQTVLA